MLRVDDYHPIRYFHYAPGCSDMYIRSENVLVANNRIDALVQLNGGGNSMALAKDLFELVPQECTGDTEHHSFSITNSKKFRIIQNDSKRIQSHSR